MRFILIQLLFLSGFAFAKPVCTVRGVHGLMIEWTIAIEDSSSAAISAPKNQFYDCKSLAATLADWQKSGQCNVDWNQVTGEALGVVDIQSISQFPQYTKMACQKQFEQAAKTAPSQPTDTAAAPAPQRQASADGDARRD